MNDDAIQHSISHHLALAVRAVRTYKEEVMSRPRWMPRSREERLRYWYARRCAQYYLTRLRINSNEREGASAAKLIASHAKSFASRPPDGLDELLAFIEEHEIT